MACHAPRDTERTETSTQTLHLLQYEGQATRLEHRVKPKVSAGTEPMLLSQRQRKSSLQMFSLKCLSTTIIKPRSQLSRIDDVTIINLYTEIDVQNYLHPETVKYYFTNGQQPICKVIFTDNVHLICNNITMSKSGLSSALHRRKDPGRIVRQAN